MRLYPDTVVAPKFTSTRAGRFVPPKVVAPSVRPKIVPAKGANKRGLGIQPSTMAVRYGSGIHVQNRVGVARPSPREAVRGLREEVTPGNRTPDEMWQDFYRDGELAKALDKANPGKDYYTRYRTALKNDSDYQWLLRHGGGRTVINAPTVDGKEKKIDLPNRVINVAQAQTLGLPVDAPAVNQYIKDALHIAKQGISPEIVPKLLLTADAEYDIEQLKASVRMKGYTQEEVNDMNFGELVGKSIAPAKYADPWYRGPGGRMFATAWSHAPEEIGKNIIGTPQMVSSSVSALYGDVRDAIKIRRHAVSEGRWDDLKPSPHWTKSPLETAGAPKWARTGVMPLGLQVPFGERTKPIADELQKSVLDQYVKLIRHPQASFEFAPFGSATAAWSLVYPGAGLLGKTAFKPGTRQFNLGRLSNRGTSVIAAKTSMPKMPMVITKPGDPMPTSPLDRPIAELPPHNPDWEFVPGRAPNTFAQERLPGIGSGVQEGTRQSDPIPLPGVQRNVMDKDQATRKGIRGYLVDRKGHISDIGDRADRVEVYEKEIKEMGQRLNNRDDIPTDRELKRRKADLEKQRDDSYAAWEADPTSRVKENAFKINEKLVEQHDAVAQTVRAKRRAYRFRINQLRTLINDEHGRILDAHVSLGLPYKGAEAMLLRKQAELQRLLKSQKNPKERDRLRKEIENLQKLSGEDPEAPFLTVVANMRLDDFDFPGPDEVMDGRPNPEYTGADGGDLEFNDNHPYLMDENGMPLNEEINPVSYAKGVYLHKAFDQVNAETMPESGRLVDFMYEVLQSANLRANMRHNEDEHLHIPPESDAYEQYRTRLVNELVPDVLRLAQQHFGRGWRELDMPDNTPPNSEMRLRLKGFLQDVQRLVHEYDQKRQGEFRTQEAIAEGRVSGKFMQQRATQVSDFAAEEAARIKAGEKRWAVDTSRGVFHAWGKTKTETAKMMQEMGYHVLDIVPALGKMRSIDEPSVSKLVAAERMPKPHEPIEYDFKGGKQHLIPPPSNVRNPVEIVNVLDRLKGYPRIVREYRDHIASMYNSLQTYIDWADTQHPPVNALNEINRADYLEGALKQIDDWFDENAGNFQILDKSDYHHVPGEQLELYSPEDQAIAAQEFKATGKSTPFGTFRHEALPAAKLGMAPGPGDRRVFHGGTVDQPLVQFEGVYATNLIDRFVQKMGDRILGTEKSLLGYADYKQGKFVKKEYMKEQGHARRAFYIRRETLLDLVNKANDMTQDETIATLQAHLQGVKPSQMLKFFQTILANQSRISQRKALGQEFRNIARKNVPRGQILDEFEKVAKESGNQEAVDWVQRFRGYIKNEDYLDDFMFGDMITSYWKPSKDIENQIKLWQGIQDRGLGDDITPQMQAFMDEARVQSTRIDKKLSDSGVIPHEILDNRRLNRQKLVSAVLHEEIPLDDTAIYVGDRATTAKDGDYLFRRSRSIDAKHVLRGRFMKNRGELLMEGLINPSFGNYYSGLTSIESKLDAIKLQQDVLERFAHKVPNGQLTYDKSKFTLYDASTGVAVDSIKLRVIMDYLNRKMPEHESFDMMQDQQNIRFRDPRDPGAGNMQRLADEDKLAAQNGDLYLVPNGLYNRMVKPVTSATLNHWAAQMFFTKPTQFFRKIALFVRPAYLIVNSIESLGRTMWFGGVMPTGLARGASMGRKFKQDPELKAALIPEWIQRSTYAGDVRRSQHLSAGAPDWLSNLYGDKHDAMVRLRRTPFFGQTLDLIKYIAGAKWSDQVLSATARGENYLRESMILNGQLKAARRYRYPKWYQFQKYYKGIDDHMLNLMKQIASDKPFDAKMAGQMDEVIQGVTRVLGDFSHAERAKLAIAFPFYRWVSFITKFVLWESPVHYPGRTLVLQNMSQMGFSELQQMGVLPPNIQGALPISGVTEETDADGNINKVMSIMYSQAWNGLSTVVNLFGINPATGKSDPKGGIAHQLNPFAQAAFAAVTVHDLATLRQLQTPNRDPLDQSLETFTQLGFSNVMKAFWPLMLNYDFNEQADTSIPDVSMGLIPFFGQWEKLKKDPTGKTAALQQPQSSFTEKFTAALLGIRRRKYNLTRLQQRNIIDAINSIKTVYDALPEKDQPAFEKKFYESLDIQMRYMAEWTKRYGDPTIQDEWMKVLLNTPDAEAVGTPQP